MRRRRIPREMRPEHAAGGLRRTLRRLGIGFGAVLVATAVVPGVGVVIAVVFWLLLAATLGLAVLVAAGPVRRHGPVLLAGLAALARWVGWAGVLRPRWRRSWHRRRELVPAIAMPRVPPRALPPAQEPRDGQPRNHTGRAGGSGWAA